MKLLVTYTDLYLSLAVLSTYLFSCYHTNLLHNPPDATALLPI